MTGLRRSTVAPGFGHKTQPSDGAYLVVAFALLGLTFLPRAATAGCGCQKPPPDLANVRPNATYAGAEVKLFSPGFVVGSSYTVDFASGTSPATASVTTTAVSSRDLADGVYKPQLVVSLPGGLPLGPTRVTARLSNLTTPILSLSDDAFTVVPLPVALPQDVGSSSYNNFVAAVGRDGTFYIALDMTAVTLPRVFRAQAMGYPLRFLSSGVTFFNIQGFHMQLLGANMPGLYSIVAANTLSDSDTLGYSRHEFSTYYLNHQERQPHALDPTDPNWHVDGTRHVDHNHLVLAIAGLLNDGSTPVPGSTPSFNLVVDRYSLFKNGLVAMASGSGAMELDNSSASDSYDSRNMSYGHQGDVLTNGALQITGWAMVDGNATASSFALYKSGTITGLQIPLTQPEVVMPVKVPDLLTDLGTISLYSSQTSTIRFGSYKVSSISLVGSSSLYIDNCVGPVTIYITSTSSALSLSSLATINTCDPNPEKFAIYVANSGSVALNGSGQFHGVVYAPQSSFNINSSADFFGAFIGNTMHTSMQSRVHYDPALRGQ